MRFVYRRAGLYTSGCSYHRNALVYLVLGMGRFPLTFVATCGMIGKKMGVWYEDTDNVWWAMCL